MAGNCPGCDGLRLLVISADTYPPFRVDVKDLFGRELCAKGYGIDWIMQSKEECDIPYKIDWNCGYVWVGATNNGTGFLAKLHKNLLGIRNDLRLFEMVRGGEYDIIQVKDKFISALFAAYAARKYKLKFAYWLSFPYPEAALYLGWHRLARYPLLEIPRGAVLKVLLYKVILKCADHVFVQSEQMKLDVVGEGIEPSKITPVVMGVSLHEMVPAVDDPIGCSERSPKRVLYLGAMGRGRRIDFVIRVFAKVRRAIEDVELVLVGGSDPAGEAFLRAEINKYDLGDQVKITGFLPMKSAWAYVASADVCLSPFFPTPFMNSTSPTKLIEYMGFARPVVANHHPEQTRVIQESGGGLCVDYDEDAFAEAVLWLLRHPLEAKAMGLKGRKYVEEFRDYAKIGELVDGTYRTFL